MKTLKLTKAELKKIFLRPVMWVLFFVLLVSVAISTITFNPTERQQTQVNVNSSSVSTAFNNFFDDANANGKAAIDNILITERESILTFFDKMEEDEKIITLKAKVTLVQNAIEIYLPAIILSYNTDQSTTPDDVIATFNQVRMAALDVNAYLKSEFSENVTFFIRTDDYNTLVSFFKSIVSNTPTNFQNYGQQFKTHYEFLTSNYNFSSLSQILNQNITPLALTKEKFDPILQAYSTDILDENNSLNTLPKLNALLQEISAFVDEVEAKPEQLQMSESAQDIATLEEYFSKYKSISLMSTTVLKNEFLLAKTEGKTDLELRNYIGFEEFESYSLKQNSTLNKYLLENNLFDYEFLAPFSFNASSGQSINAFDFTVYAMQITSLIIVVFSIFIASGTIANEQASGTIKMIAIRPYSRPKIITAKLFSVLLFMLIMLLLSFVVTFTVGMISYGISQVNVLAIFNANNVIILNGFVLLAIYLVSIFLNMTFYITIALLLSTVAKSNAIALIISILIYVGTLIGNFALAATGWLVFLPIAHLDLYRYFGTMTNTGQLFGFTMPLNANFGLSLIYLIATILVLYMLTISTFKKRSIA